MANTSDLIAAIIRSAQFTIVGRVARDPEARYFQSGTCKTQINLAVNRPGAKKGDDTPPGWFKAELWGEDAEAAVNELRKGDLVSVTGRIATESWTTREGEQRTDLVIKAQEWGLVGGNAAPTPAAAAAPAPAPSYANDALPF